MTTTSRQLDHISRLEVLDADMAQVLSAMTGPNG